MVSTMEFHMALEVRMECMIMFAFKIQFAISANSPSSTASFTRGQLPRPLKSRIYLSIYLGCFPQFGGVADNTKETTKQWGFHSVLLAMTRDPAEFGWHCWSNTAHPPPSSTTYAVSYMPSPLPQGRLYKATPWQQQMPIRTASQSFATHSYP